MHVAILADNPLFSYLDAQGNHQGFDLKIEKHIVKDLLGDESKVKFVLTEAANRVEYLKANKVDIIFANFTVTPERKEVVDFSTADLFFTKQHPEIKLQKYGQNTETFDALKDGRGAALAHDNLLVLAWAKQNPNYTVSIKTLGQHDLIAPAVKKGDQELLDWLNKDLAKLKQEGVIQKVYEDTLKPVYGDNIDVKDLLVE